MLNDVIFNNEKSAYIDWGIVLTQKDIALPNPKTSTVDIRGADGVLDLTTVLTEDIKYSNRKIKLTFEMLELAEYTELISKICNYLHGKVVTISFANDPEYYYKGRATINQWQCSKNKGTIVVSVDAEPYKLENNQTVVNVTVNGDSKTFVLPNSRMVLCPMLSVTGSPNLTFEGETISLNEGEYQLLNFELKEGENIVTLSGNGNVKFTYRRGDL